ncbi:RNA-binding protein 48 isoform X1 [Venturia canescens]|uniref:RNA-binding protein 48 isoform X1 n=1 Tax=Venturia canescens TaxID=32260 RepID=UPI001C9CFE18|nr:RNA-binding protein 48 isoform X1 [Venturia canescens]
MVEGRKRILKSRGKQTRNMSTLNQRSLIQSIMTAQCGIVKMQHHEQQELCQTRAPYRQGRKLTAVKVYTVNDESSHIIINGVPKLQLLGDVSKMVTPYGSVKRIELILDYPVEEFTEAFHINFERIQSARIAKRFIDGKNFFGGLLHVFYAPELETVAETRKKLVQRRRDIAIRIKRHKEDPTNLDTDEFEPREQYHRKKKYPTLPLTEKRLLHQYQTETLSTIYKGIPRSIDPRPISEPSLPKNWNETRKAELNLNDLATPYDGTDILGRSILTQKKKNYRGRPINKEVKVSVVRPQIIDTTKLAGFMEKTDKQIFPVVKKVESGITIKVLKQKIDDGKKRIVMKDPSASLLVQPSNDLQESIKTIKSNIRKAMKNN